MNNSKRKRKSRRALWRLAEIMQTFHKDYRFGDAIQIGGEILSHDTSVIDLSGSLSSWESRDMKPELIRHSPRFSYTPRFEELQAERNFLQEKILWYMHVIENDTKFGTGKNFVSKNILVEELLDTKERLRVICETIGKMIVTLAGLYISEKEWKQQAYKLGYNIEKECYNPSLSFHETVKALQQLSRKETKGKNGPDLQAMLDSIKLFQFSEGTENQSNPEKSEDRQHFSLETVQGFAGMGIER